MMTNNIKQNRLVIELASQCLNSSNSEFAEVSRNKDQGTFPHVYATARHKKSGVEYLIGITGRVERQANGDWNPGFNFVQNAGDYREARRLVTQMKKELAFVAVALRSADGAYAIYFGELDAIYFPRAIPMLPTHRDRYRLLADYTQDERVKELLTP